MSVNAATNRLSSYTYDANGNMTIGPNGGMAYDSENRMIQATPLSGGTYNYAYDAQNKRVWAWDGNTDSNGNASTYNVYFYGLGGKRLAAYQVTLMYNPTPYLVLGTISQETYFGSRRLAPMDRLGSTNGKFYPYGEDKPGNPANGTWKFGTYFRDSATGLDYADQRYYSSGLGRFTIPDPLRSSANPSDPQSWNRFTYLAGDPVNHTDSRGLNVDARFEEDEGDDEASIGQTQSSGGGGGGYFVFQQPSGYIPFQDSISDTGQTALPIYTVDSKPATDSSQSVASQSAGNIAVGNEQRPGPLTTLFNATNSLLSALSILPNFTIIAPIPTTLGLLGVQADIAYLPKTGQVCPSIGLNFSPGGAYGFTISLLLDPQNVAPNVIPGFSAGFGMQPVIGAGISATGSFGQPLLTGPSIGYRGVGISASWGACWP